MKSYVRIPLALLVLLSCALAASAAVVVGAYYYLVPSLPDAQQLREVRLQVPLSVYSRDGRLIAQMGEQRRTPVSLDDVPQRMIDAFLAAEDERFYQHPGFDLRGIARAGLAFIATGSISRGGGSTITQQLARNFFLGPEQTVVRKTRELFLAVRIERELEKDEILELYLNKIFLGQRAHGVSAAASVYFGKSLAELETAEIATIAGLPKAPSTDNPVRSPQRATQRRAYVLRRMLETGAIDQAEHDQATGTPMLSRLHGPRIELDAPYVAEMVRSDVLARFGPDAYEAGYRVVTTVDSRLQRASDRALRQALLEYDRRHGWRGPVARLGEDALVPATDLPLEAHYRTLVSDFPQPAVLRIGVVLDTDEREARVHLRDRGEVTVGWSGLSWARRHIATDRVGRAPEEASDVLAPGDIVYLVELASGDWALTQIPDVQGALVALDPNDGAITALSGGFDFFVSKFNRAVQARRQPGSSFKPFVFSAALEHGYTAASLVNDAPLVFESTELEQAWRPENYSRRWGGPTRLREALVRSLNLVSVRVLLGAGVSPTITHLEGFGFNARALPRNPTLALGAGDLTPLELTAGYAVFANGGHRVEPYLIERIIDGAGRVVYEANPPRVPCHYCESPELLVPEVYEENGVTRVRLQRASGALRNGRDDQRLVDVNATRLPAAERVISPQNAWIISDMMADVIRRGTGQRARRELGRDDLAGKTGTSNDRRDAWFAGYNGSLVATAWVGFDQERSLGLREEGGRTALPMWNYFMAQALTGVPEHERERPPGLVEVRISPQTGRVAPAGASGVMFEVFQEGRVPPPDESDNDEDGDFDESDIFF